MYWNTEESFVSWPVLLFAADDIIFCVCDFDYDFFFLSYFLLLETIFSSYTQARKFSNAIPDTNTFDLSLLFAS